MLNVIGFSDYVSQTVGGTSCWLCQKTVSLRALFCHNCGTIQPVRDIDHFARLGIDRSIDIDAQKLDHQFAALSRTLDPQRFLIRGIGERGHAAKQLEALTEAYHVLREPLRRGRYWLSLHDKDYKHPKESHPVVRELRQDLDRAAEPAHCDRVAHKAGLAMEQGIVSLMQALRGENWQQAGATLVDLDGLEAILGDVRVRRAALTPDGK